MTAFRTCDEMDNLDKKSCRMTLSECKNYNFPSNGKISIIAYILLSFTHAVAFSILNIANFLNSWMLEPKILYILETLKTKCLEWYDICCILCVYIYARYNQSFFFFSVSFHFWVAWYYHVNHEYYQNRINQWYWKLIVKYFFC